jgi:hypothetical protein
MKGHLALAVGALCLLASVSASAQSDRGSIAGMVLDSSGAAVSGAAVVVRGADTGSVYKTVTTGDGHYRIADVAIGRYDVSVDVPGFKVSVQKGVPVQINTVTALNITLQPGSTAEQVTVEADAPQIQTESSDLGTVVGNKQIEDLPLALNSTGQSFVRSPETFVFLTPGTTGPGTNSDHASAGVFESKLSGGQNFGTEILLDGISVQREDSGAAFDQTAPTVEALTEFKVTTSTPSAEFGHTSGGIESFTTKFGTNRYHGSVFELFRNEALDAFLWDQAYQNGIARYHNQLIAAWNQANPGNTANFETITKKPRDRQNDFGGSLGGPVRIPHLYDGHDKTFFFFAWEQYRNRKGLLADATTLPSAAERGGDFSALLGPGVMDSNGNPVINPCNGQQVLQGEIFDPSTTQVVNGQTCRLPFAQDNHIPVTSQVAQKVLSYVPQPNRGGSGPGGISGNFLNPAPLDHIITTQTSFRIDENLTEKSKLFFSYHSREQYPFNGPTVDLPTPLEGGNYKNYYYTHYLRFGWDYVVSPAVLNHLTVGLNRVYTAAKALSVNGSDWEKVLGISGASGGVFPSFSYSNAPTGIGYSSFGGGNYTVQVPNALLVADSVSWVRGAHSLHFGFDWRSYQYSVENLNTSPAYSFDSAQTAFAPKAEQAGAASTGDPFASFLLGQLSSESVTVSSHYPRWNQNYYAAFLQDDYKFRRNLTVNLGLRWDVDTPRHEARGAQSVFSPTANNPASPGQPGAFIYGKNATGANTYYKDFGPRVGFAWSPGFVRDTVLRGGYGIYYAQLTYGDFGMNLASGTTINQTFQGPPDNFSPVPQGGLDSGFPAFPLPSNQRRDPALNAFTFNGADYVAPDYGRPGMVQNWDLEIQHQLASDLILSVGYVGQHATRLRSNLAQPNVLNPKYNFLGNELNFLVDGTDGNNGPAILNQLGVTVPSWFVPGWASTGNSSQATIGQLLRPFPQYTNISANCCLENLGQSTYNAMQAKLERRFRNGFNLLASYTFSKTITDADTVFSSFTGFQTNSFGAQNPYNLKSEKQLSYQDIPHIVVLSYLYEPPVGPGKKYLNHGAAGAILGGWQIGGVLRYQSGSPAAINQFATSNPYSTGNYRFSRIPGQPLFGTGKWSPAAEVQGVSISGVSGGAASFSGGWDSGCTENGSGVFQPRAAQPTIANCNAYLDPSGGSLQNGGGYIFGNLSTIVPFWRGQPYYNEDFSIIKRTMITEGKALSLKFDIPNAFNRHTLGTINGNPGDPHFGAPGFTFFGGPNSNNGPRDIQITARFEF